MSRKKKNGKPTNRELRRARERVDSVPPPKRAFSPPQASAKFCMGDCVKLTNRIYARFGELMTIRERRWFPISQTWGYRMAGPAWYPEEDIRLVEGTPARATGLDLGEL